MGITAEKVKTLFPQPRVAALLATPALTIHWEEIPLALMRTLVEGPALVAEGGRIVAILSPMFRLGFDWGKLLTMVLDPLAAEWPTIYAEGGKLVQIWLPVFGPPAA